MSHDEPSIRDVSTALRRLVSGWDHFRQSIADQLQVGTTEVGALVYLYDEGQLTPRELGERLGLTSGSVTALLDRLERAGFVSRSQNPDDRRSLFAAPTPSGRHAVQWFYEQLDTVIGDALADVPGLRRDLVVALAIATGQALTERGTELPDLESR